MAVERARWTNWCGLETASPMEVLEPADASEVAAAVRRAGERARTVKMVGTGHSFTGIAAPGHTMLRPDRLGGILAVDRESLEVTAGSGTPLKELNSILAGLGLSLHNMGDIAEQTLAGAVSTGTHGSGGLAAGLAAQVTGLELVDGTGEMVRIDGSDADLLDLARVGLGALGVLTTLTFAVEPAFLLQAEERPISWEELLDRFDELTATSHHLDAHWFPHTDGVLLKTNTRLADDVSSREPLRPWQAWVDDDLLSNRVFGAITALTSRVPALTATANRVAAHALSPRRYSDVAHRVFVSRRDVVFREMEYAVPREAGLDALREARALIEWRGWRVNFPVEIRTAPADSGALSTAYGRDSLYLAFHVHGSSDHTAYFGEVERVMRSHGGRPHWGKLHSLTAADLAPLYPRFEEFLALRDRLDPRRLFTNPYLDRVLGR